MSYNLILIPSNKQEWEDIHAFIFTSNKSKFDSICVFDLSAMYREGPIVSDLEESTKLRVHSSLNPFSIGYYKGNILNKIYLIILNTSLLSFFILKYRAKVVFYTNAIAAIRFSKVFFQKVLYVLYIRAAWPGMGRDWSFSDMTITKVKKYLNVDKIEWIDTLFGDLHFLSGTSQRKMLIEKGYNPSRIFVCGPAYLHKINKKLYHRREKVINIIYAMQAFLRHDDIQGHYSQCCMIKELIKWHGEREDCNLILRLHPRDSLSNYDFLSTDSKIIINSSPLKNFIKSYISNSILIGMTSTLLFEWAYLGGITTLLRPDKYFDEFQDFYMDTGCQPVYINDFLASFAAGRLFKHASIDLSCTSVMCPPEKVQIDFDAAIDMMLFLSST
jgi:hypothetical protein